MSRSNKDKLGPQGTRMFNLSEVPETRTVVEPTLTPVEGVALVGKSGSTKGQTFGLQKGSNSIGRSESNDIHLPHGSVSSQHARITLQDGTWRVTNLLSSNGTFVNGERVTRRELSDGDEVRFGDSQFVFQNDASGKKSLTLRFSIFAAAAIVVVAATIFLIV